MGYLKSTSNLNADRITAGTVDIERLPASVIHPKITVGVIEPENPSVGDLWYIPKE